ncbi:MAG: O-antigen ligase family protein [Desulfobaccales bacterium]
MKYLSYIFKTPLFNRLAFYALLASGASVILLCSPNILGKRIDYWDRIIIFILPWGMLWLAYACQVLTNRDHRFEIILIVAIITLGVINAFLSDSVAKSTPQMRDFLAGGVFALWASMFLLTGQHRRQVFDWLCCICLAIIVPVEVIWWFVRDANHNEVFHIFTLHAIPLGTLIILLSPGPIHLLVSKNFKVKLCGWLLVLSSLTLIFITHKRSTWLAMAAMLVLGILYLVRRRRYLLVTLFVVMTLILSVQAKRMYAHLDPDIPRYASILQRVELYNFALHIWETHPFLGMGLRPMTHAKYLTDYHQLNKNLTDFPQSVAKLQTFDNLVLTGFVELGSLMTLTYLGLVLFIVARYIRALRSSPATEVTDWYRLLVLFGLFIHSMSYDSLLFPPINWLFHVQLGIMAGYYASNQVSGSVSRQPQVAT